MTDNNKTAKLELDGKTYDLPVLSPTAGPDVIDIRKLYGQAGVFTYDPGYTSTASCDSTITFIDGEEGVLLHRGYPIDQLAGKSHYLEVCYLLLYGELPTATELKIWNKDIKDHTMVHENLKKFIDGFHYDAHPMGMLVSTVAALSTYYPDAKNIGSKTNRRLQQLRLISKMPTLAAYAYRHSQGLPYIYPDIELSYTENFMNMLWRRAEPKYDPNPVLARALDVLFILHADHEQNCSTSTMRTIGSSNADPYVSLAGACGALYGPLHGGANEAVLSMLDEIGSMEKIPAFVKEVKEGERRLMGFGHRVYKNYDPRAKIIKKIADDVFEVTGKNPKIELAKELERIALEDDYFVKRRLYPNVDFYSGIIYEAMGFKPEMFTVLFALGRTVGWLAHWEELMEDPERRIARPRQIYLGPGERELVPIEERLGRMQSERK